MKKTCDAHVLVVDDEAEVCRFFEEFLRGEKGCEVSTAQSGQRARELMRSQRFSLAFLDLKLPDASGIELLEELRNLQPECRAVIMTGHGTVRSAVKAVRLGAFDYLEKPFEELDELERVVNAALDLGVSAAAKGGVGPEGFNIICSEKSPLWPVLEVARKIARKNLTALITGPTGAGKEVLARFIHAWSPRSGRPFISVNCGAFSETLLESELFGHERGAFTGASSARRGIFEIANGGTLFLDEIGEATPAIQVKLLRTLETGEFMRVGGEKPLTTDVRIIAATNSELKEAVSRGSFRRDLYYRLDVVTFEVPPLSERRADIDLLLNHFADKFAHEGETITFTVAAREALRNYTWPGNVREMANVIARAAALREGNLIDRDVLPPKIAGGARPAAMTGEALEGAVAALGARLFDEVYGNGRDGNFDELLDGAKKLEASIVGAAIGLALERADGNRAKAARLLNANPRALRYYLKEKGKG